jgi:hypothetical protein
MPTITPFLWFDGVAEEAATLKNSLFKKGSTIKRLVRYSEAGRAPMGLVMTVEFSLTGQNVVALNGRPPFTCSRHLRRSTERLRPILIDLDVGGYEHGALRVDMARLSEIDRHCVAVLDDEEDPREA